MIKLGDKVKDKVTGFTGIAIARTEWLNGCIRVTVQPDKLADGKIAASETIDEPQLTLVKAAAVKVAVSDTGGPIPAPIRGQQTKW